MKRIIKFMLLAAFVLPAWATLAAQNTVPPKGVTTDVPSELASPAVESGGVLSAAPELAGMATLANTMADDHDYSPYKAIKGVRAEAKPRVVKVTKSRANVPDGYSLITLTVLDTEGRTGVWGDGTGYQMLLDADHNTFGSIIPETGAITTSGDVPATTYAEFEYKIPENADGALSTSNIIISGTQSITIPAGTYDWCITNPTPTGNYVGMWIAAEQGDVNGRYNDYVFESGFAYTFTISLVGENDNVAIDITSNYENPTNLVASHIHNNNATLTWTAGGDEASWNLQYRKKSDYYEWTTVGTLTSTNYLLDGLDASTAYQARVQGVYADGLSGWTQIAFTTAAADALCAADEMGQITYDLHDSYSGNDGWNGAYITIQDAETGTIIETLTIPSGSNSLSGTVSLCYGREVNFVWTRGSYDRECSFTITDPDGDVIASATTYTCNNWSNNYVFASYTMNMPVKPTNLAVSNVKYNRATATWDGVTEVYNLRYRANGETEWTVVNNVTSPYTMSGLASETQYEVQVQGILDGGVSNWTNSVTFTTTEGPTQSLDFGTINAGSSKTMTAKIANDGNEAVQATITVKPNPPFSVENTTVTLAANALTSIPVTFYPEDARNYNGTLTVSFNGENTIVSLKGLGYAEGPEALRDSTFFAGITYNWTDSLNQNHVSNLNEIATDPDQIIAMIREVYMNRNIPGNYKRGFTATGANEPYNDVNYGGVGTISRGSGYSSASNYSYVDGYGWNIPGNLYTTSATSTVHSALGTVYYTSMDSTQYKPYQEGVTLLLLEINDVFDKKNVTASGKSLRDYIKNSVKSVRIVTQSKRTGNKSDFSSGTLFKIDCDKMNKFYLIAKGQLRWLQNSYFAEFEYNSNTYTLRSTENANPTYFYNRYGTNSSYNGMIDTFWDDKSHQLFYNMFEEFSPVANDASSAKADIYQDLVNMESFGVEHDCMGVPYMGHQFQMYGNDSSSDDCQDIRDLMFFVPDYRMMYYYKIENGDTIARDNKKALKRQKFMNYNLEHQPKMGLFVIKQYPITGNQIENQETYKLHLTWTSNLLEFLPQEQGQYTLYRVITNADGTKTYQTVGEFNPNTFEYYDDVPMQKNGQQVTYVVEGQDVGKFLSLQMSNEESFIIPGLDRAEQIRINLNNDYYFSRYDAAEQKNFYSNSLIANNTVGTNVKPSYLENGSQFKFWRATLKEVEEDGVTTTVVDTDNAVNFVKAEVSNWDPTTGGTLTYKEWVNQADFSTKPYKHGYHANVETSTISIDDKDDQITTNDEVVFDGLKLYDNFSVDITDANDHPVQYVYYVTLETAEPFGLIQNLPSWAVWQEDRIFVYFEAPYSDWYEVRAYAWDGDDHFAGEWAGTEMTNIGTFNGKKVYQWSIAARDNGALPAYIIFSWKDGYNTFHQTQNLDYSNGGYYTITDVNNSTGSLVATTSAANTSNQARSNTVSVPVYKTAMTMNPITAAQVEADVDHQIPAATKFDVKTRYSSKSEILGYYIYRWADGKTAASARSIYESDGEDSSPQGQAGNQSEYYSVAMNTDFTGRTENFEDNNYADVTASFEDNYMVNDAKEGDTYTYAPVVELFAPPTAVNLDDNSDRDDYNTYGGPQQMTAGGIVNVNVIKAERSNYEWEDKGNTYTYYNVFLDVTKLDLPTGYEVAKVRAWRKIDSQYLGEQEHNGYQGRLELNDNGEYKFVERATCAETDMLGQAIVGSGNVYEGTFGALKLTGNNTIPMDFVVRVYFTKTVSAKAGDPNGDYYIAEYNISDELNANIPTAVDGIVNAKAVASVKYYNMAGVESDKPFDGVNMVVTRYNDGSVSTQKMMK